MHALKKVLLSYPVPESSTKLSPPIHLKELRQSIVELVGIEDIVELIYPHHDYPTRCRGVVKQVHGDDIVCLNDFWQLPLLILDEWHIGKWIDHSGGLYTQC
jgi:hypothetical protein